ncbi:DUF2339 domain-containing protein [Candidatus Uhrbacteria bacterium]|nr:DUF2339 domain-containing protein [Candidatus Uhrbacteria bacterium]
MEILVLLLFVAVIFLTLSVIALWSRINGIERRLQNHAPAKPSRMEPAVREERLPESKPMREEKKSSQSSEFKLGGKLYSIIGGFAVLLGLGFLLRFAIENNLISAPLRVLLGIVVGLVLILLGLYLHEKMKQFAQILSGIGLGALYLSLYAATQLYSLLPLPLGFAALAAVSIVGILLALRHDSQPLAIYAQIGGYLTPLILSGGGNTPHTLFIYLLVLNTVMLAVSWKKPWRALASISFAGTAICYTSWADLYIGSTPTWVPLLYIDLFFLQFLGRTLIRVWNENISDGWDVLLILINPLVFFTFAFQIINTLEHARTFQATLSLGGAVLYLLLAAWRITMRKRTDDADIAFIGMGSIFFAIAPLIWFDDMRWSIGAWAFLGLVLGILADRLRSTWLDYLAHGFFFVAGLTLLSEYPDPVSGTWPWLNPRMALYALVIAAFIGNLWYNERKRQSNHGAKRSLMASIHIVATFVVTLLAVTSEVNGFYAPADLWTAAATVILGALAGMAGIWIGSASLRSSGYLAILFGGLTTIIYSFAINPDTHRFLINPQTAALLLCAAITYALLAYMRTALDHLTLDERRLAKPMVWLASNFFLLTMISLETWHLFKPGLDGYDNERDVALSVVWSIYAIALVAFGIYKKSKLARTTALALFGIVIAKVVLIDTSELDNFYRFITFISLGIILLISGFLYNKFKTRIEG